METKWTYRKPPEESMDDYNPVIYWVDDSKGVPIADIKDNANPEENARLIAAAPELLEALTRLSVAVGEADALQHAGMKVPAKVWAEIYQANLTARAVLAKAEGKE